MIFPPKHWELNLPSNDILLELPHKAGLLFGSSNVNVNEGMMVCLSARDTECSWIGTDTNFCMAILSYIKRYPQLELLRKQSAYKTTRGLAVTSHRITDSALAGETA